MRLYGNWKRCLGHMEEHSYSRLLNMLEYKGVKPEDRKDFRLYFDRESLLARFEAGRHRVSMNYRRLFDGDRLRHVQLAVYMYQEPAGNHIFGVFCLLDREGGRTQIRNRKGQDRKRRGMSLPSFYHP